MTARYTLESLAGKRVTVMGLGRFGGGVGVTRWLCSQGAIVTVSDLANEDQLTKSIKQLDGCNPVLHLGGHLEEDILGTELLVINPAIPNNVPILLKAGDVPKTTAINMFLDRCPAPVIAITGSAGKSTTTAMTGAILSEKFNTHVGGNIGVSLLNELPEINDTDIVVLELSSFQLERLSFSGASPKIAIVTNIRPNHLDRHGEMRHYIDAKKNLLLSQTASGITILNGEDQELSTWAEQAKGSVEFFYSPNAPEFKTEDSFELARPGVHNQANVQAAWTAAKHLGVTREQAAKVLKVFTGLPNRLKTIADVRGVVWVDDSNCTSPDEADVALDAFKDKNPIMLLGGYDKGINFEEFAGAVAQKAKAAIAYGATGEALYNAVEKARGNSKAPVLELVNNMTDAIATAARIATCGDSVLLSPACASYDEFDNYQSRGKKFAQLVQQLK